MTVRERERVGWGGGRGAEREKVVYFYSICCIVILNFNSFLISIGDINWAEFSLLLPLLALTVGILSSLLGVGGGELMGPLMLHLKVELYVTIIITIIIVIIIAIVVIIMIIIIVTVVIIIMIVAIFIINVTFEVMITCYYSF